MFYHHVLQRFNEFNLIMQSSRPLIFDLYDTSEKFFLSVVRKFVTFQAEVECADKFQIPFDLESSQVSDDELQIGKKTWKYKYIFVILSLKREKSSYRKKELKKE